MILASAPSTDLHDRLRAYLSADPATLADPYPLFRDLREAGAVHDLGTTVVVPRYGEVKAVLRDAGRLSSRTFVGLADRGDEGHDDRRGARRVRGIRPLRRHLDAAHGR